MSFRGQQVHGQKGSGAEWSVAAASHTKKKTSNTGEKPQPRVGYEEVLWFHFGETNLNKLLYKSNKKEEIPQHMKHVK